MPKSICAVIPAFNEARIVQNVVKHATKFVDQVFVVDDRSTNNTAKLAAKAGVIILQNRFDRSAHLATLWGIKSSNCDIVVNLDTDGQQPPEVIPKLLKPILDGD